MPQWAGSGSSDNEIAEIFGLGQRRPAANSTSSGQNSTAHGLPSQSHTSYDKHPQNGRDGKKHSALGYHDNFKHENRQSDVYEDEFDQLNVSNYIAEWPDMISQ